MKGIEELSKPLAIVVLVLTLGFVRLLSSSEIGEAGVLGKHIRQEVFEGRSGEDEAHVGD